jgi:hypothetical protein
LTFGPESCNFDLRQDNISFDLGAVLGAAESASIECLTLYIPSKDAGGNDFDQRPWVDEALALLSAIGGGATVLPPAEGAWFNPETGTFIKESVVLTYTYVDPDRFVASLGNIPAVLIMTGEASANPIGVIARSDSDAATPLIGALFRRLPRRCRSSQ